MPFDSQTQFGFKKVSPQDKATGVFNVFKSVASSYDVMNNLMSGGLHHYWKQELVNMVAAKSGMIILDAAGGTGDIAIKLVESCKHYPTLPHITVYDQNPDMLHQGKMKAYDKGIFSPLTWVEGDAAALPFPDHTFDAITISFGLRNVTHMKQALSEFYRTLKPGGNFYCLEFSKITDPFLHKIYKQYAFRVIPRIGAWVAKDEASYRYLVESIDQFPGQIDLMNLLNEIGFDKTGYRNLTKGVVAIHSGCKPMAASS